MRFSQAFLNWCLLRSRDVYCFLNGVNPVSGAGCVALIEEKVV
jgi:hypothetical protein